MTTFTTKMRTNWVVQKSPLIIALMWITSSSIVCAADHETIERGRELFERQWTFEPPALLEKEERETDAMFAQRLSSLPGDGLGPMFNATSCEACHAGGGGAGVDRNVTLLTLDPRSEALDSKKQSQQATRKELIRLYPGLLSPRGVLSMDVVVHEKSARPFYDSIRQEISTHVPGGAPPQWFVSSERTIDAIANRPVLAGRVGNLDFYLSQRNSPPLFGLGIIDKIDQSRLRLIARSQSKRTRGKVTGRVGAGKFGWRAQTQTLDQFVRGACAGEVGLQVTRTPQPADAADETYVSLGIDLQESEVNMLVSYVRSLPRPMQETRLPEEAVTIRDGKRLFTKIGCAVCHVETISFARGIYSDLLLHDMGSLLQAPSPAPAGTSLSSMPRLRIPVFRPSRFPIGVSGSAGGYYGVSSSATPRPYEVSKPEEPKFPRGEVPKSVLETRNVSEVTWDMLQREWRTPPLWGVADSAPYLHDGRAATLESAIRWHGGEASDSAIEFRSLTKEGRGQIIAFLGSLRAPPSDLLPNSRAKPKPVAKPTTARLAADDPTSELQMLADAIDVFQQGY